MSSHGQATAEAIIVLPIFILIMMITIHFGKVMVAQSRVYVAAREGALKESRDSGEGISAVFFGQGTVDTSSKLFKEASFPNFGGIFTSFLNWVMEKGSAKMDVTHTVKTGPFLKPIFGEGTTVKGSCRFLGFCLSRTEIVAWLMKVAGDLVGWLGKIL
ncbi:pilus assembly protein [bacterium]|nr:pilus assembly protein [bacterium]